MIESEKERLKEDKYNSGFSGSKIKSVQEEYELVEVHVQRYAGWREHAEEAGYIVDSLDRVFKRE